MEARRDAARAALERTLFYTLAQAEIADWPDAKAMVEALNGRLSGK